METAFVDVAIIYHYYQLCGQLFVSKLAIQIQLKVLYMEVPGRTSSLLKQYSA